MKRIKYQEGDVFVFPLRSDGYGVGLITRISSDKHRIPLGYFFKHKYASIPNMIDPSLIEKHKTVLISKFGIQGIRNGTWHNVGKIKEFDRADWPIPLFLRHTEPFPPRLVQYNDDLDEIEDKKAPPNIDVSSYYRAGLDGSGAIEIRMTGLIDGNTGFIDGNN